MRSRAVLEYVWNTATEHVQPAINQYHGGGVSPGRVGTQTRSTPRAESFVGIGHAVADKQELSMWHRHRTPDT